MTAKPVIPRGIRKSQAQARVPRVKILMLGASGAGKTVYLASLYRKLSIAGSLGYHIEPETGKEIILTHLINKLIRPGSEWPAGTRKLEEWNFKCILTTKDRTFCAFEVIYVDYAGGVFTDFQEVDLEEQNKFNRQTSEANIILGLLDGKKVLDYMQNIESDDAFDLINLDLERILQEMQKSKSTTPIHFIVSKWDLIENVGGYTLRQVRDRLLLIDRLKNFIQSRGKGCIIRLIPVSSIGMNSASYERDISSGKTKTTRICNEINPFQVEIPLAYTLNDVIQVAINDLENRKCELKGFKKMIFLLRSIFFDPLEELLPLGLNWLQKKTIDLILKREEDRKISILENEIDKITHEQDALLYLLKLFRISVERFQDENPGNLLS